MSSCVFCKIIEGTIPSHTVFENEDVIAFKDIHPAHEIHYLFAPKKHIESLAEFKANQTDVIAQIFSAIFTVTKKEGLDQKGYRTMINTGEGGGQEVFHLHVHVMSGKRV